MRNIAFILAEGSKLYGTETATLKLIERLNNANIVVYSAKEELHSSFRAFDTRLGGNILQRLVHIAFYSEATIIVSCNHHVSLLLIFLSAFTGKKIICWEHAEYRYAKAYMRLFKRILYKYCTGIVTLNQNDYNYWSKLNKNVWKIWNINGENEVKCSDKHVKDIDLLYVGRFSNERGAEYFDEIFDALYQHDSRKLKIALIGDDFSKISNVHFQRFDILTRNFEESIDEYFLRSKCYINPAKFESFGLSVYRALSYGLSVVAWDSTSSAVEFAGQKGFFAVKHGDVSAFASTTQLVLSRNGDIPITNRDMESVNAWNEVFRQIA